MDIVDKLRAYRPTSGYAATMAKAADEIVRLRTALHHVECGLVAAEEDRDALQETMRLIGDTAHNASTGPAVPDVLWEIRGMAYSAV